MSAPKTSISRRQFVGAALTGGLFSGCAYTAAKPALMPGLPAPAGAGAEADALVAAPAAAPAAAAPSAPAMFRADLHCHTFNARDIPIDGFIRSLAQGIGLPPQFDGLLAKVTVPLHDALVASTPIEWADLDAAPPKEARDFRPLLQEVKNVLHTLPLAAEAVKTIANLVDTMANITKTRAEVAAAIVKAYDQIELFTPALVDFEYWTTRDKKAAVRGASTSPVKQIEAHTRISELAMKSKIAGRQVAIHPYVPFNPWRYVVDRDRMGLDGKPITVLHDVKRAVGEQGFVGVKLYPPCGFLPVGNDHLHDYATGGFGAKLDAGLEELFTWCEQDKVPILTHASLGNAFFKDAAWRGAPWSWRHVLERHRTLQLCFGHFGNLEGVLGTSDAVSCVAWADAFADLMVEYDNVYADISDSDAAQSDAKGRLDYQDRFLFWLCRRLADKDSGPKLAQRLLYGSDWWMGMIAGMDKEFFNRIEEMVTVQMKPYADTTKGAKGAFVRGFFGENALRFLGIRGDDGKVRTEDKSTAQRLRKRYDQVKPETPADSRYPRWLVDVKEATPS